MTCLLVRSCSFSLTSACVVIYWVFLCLSDVPASTAARLCRPIAQRVFGISSQRRCCSSVPTISFANRSATVSHKRATRSTAPHSRPFSRTTKVQTHVTNVVFFFSSLNIDALTGATFKSLADLNGPIGKKIDLMYYRLC